MFQSLRQNSQIYIFHKGQNPSLEIGTVTNIPVTKPKYAIPQSFNQPQEMVVDLIVKVNDRIVNYNSLPASQDIADCYTNGESLVVSDNRDAMNAEIFAYKQKSVDTINSLDVHKSIIESCEKILNNLNPEYAEKKQQQDEISNLKSQMSDISTSLAALTGMIQQLTKNEQNLGNK